MENFQLRNCDVRPRRACYGFMMLRTKLLSLSLVMLALPASADWNRNQRADFTKECLAGCQINPELESSQRRQCPAYCSCILDEAQKFISESERTRLQEVAREGGEDPKLMAFRTLTPICQQRTFNP